MMPASKKIPMRLKMIIVLLHRKDAGQLVKRHSLVAPRRPPRDACDAYGRQRTANCSLSGGDKAMNAWDPYSLPELEAECANDAGQ
jgi:hypothetical protein